MDLSKYMQIAIDEAIISLREGNNGFGAVIIYKNEILVRTHDMEDTRQDATSHAELNAIKIASRKLGKDLSSCILISTHEPCPMCATAVIWSGINTIAYGYSIEDAISQGRKRINITCEEIFKRADTDIKIYKGIQKHKCAILYNKAVRNEIEKLRDADDETLESLNVSTAESRIQWFKNNYDNFDFINEDILTSAYKLLVARFNIETDEAPISKRTDKKITFKSMNFCPTLEACKILGLDTRYICKKLNEKATDALVKQIDKRLTFTRNYDCIRPHSDYCEETISIT